MSAIRRVLIVDDNVGLAENIAEILQLDGHDTWVAASAEQGVSVARDQQPDVVVTDYRLPGIDGAAFVKRLRESQLNVHAVVISAYSDETTIKNAADVGATFLSKPVDYVLLARWVREANA